MRVYYVMSHEKKENGIEGPEADRREGQLPVWSQPEELQDPLSGWHLLT